MMFRMAACGLLLALFVLTGPVAAKEPEVLHIPIPDTWFATSVTNIGGLLHFANYWSKGPMFRAESVIAGHRVVSIVNADRYYSIDAVMQTGVAIKRDPQAIAVDAKRKRPFADEWSQLLRAGGESVGREQVQGRECEVFRLTNSTGRRTVWVSIEEPRVPVRVLTFDRNTGAEETVDYINWVRGLQISDAFFAPAANVDLLEFDYPEYQRQARIAPVGPVPVLYRSFLEAEWND